MGSGMGGGWGRDQHPPHGLPSARYFGIFSEMWGVEKMANILQNIGQVRSILTAPFLFGIIRNFIWVADPTQGGADLGSKSSALLSFPHIALSHKFVIWDHKFVTSGRYVYISLYTCP